MKREQPSSLEEEKKAAAKAKKNVINIFVLVNLLFFPIDIHFTNLLYHFGNNCELVL